MRSSGSRARERHGSLLRERRSPADARFPHSSCSGSDPSGGRNQKAGALAAGLLSSGQFQRNSICAVKRRVSRRATLGAASRARYEATFMSASMLCGSARLITRLISRP
jgi:hypothetical protein